MIKRFQDGLGTKFCQKRRQVGVPKRPEIDPKSKPKIDQNFDRKKGQPGSKNGEGSAAEARPPGRGYPGLGWGPGALGTSNLTKVILTRPARRERRGSGRIEYASGGITGRSPSFGDHLSGRQTRKHVRRSRSRVPAALFLDVLGSPWGLLGSFFSVLGAFGGVLGVS